MKSTELLFELIQSLTKAEKRYFKLFSSLHRENNNYIKLFNAIHQQKKYDESELLLLFKDEAFVRQFSVAKNYLINLIVKSLRIHHHKAKKSIELNDYLSEIEILYWKGLYKLAFKRLKQARKIAIKYEILPYLLLLNHWHRKLIDYVSEDFFNEKLEEDTQSLLVAYTQQMALGFLTNKMNKITKQTIRSTTQTVEKVKEIFKHHLMQLNVDEVANFHAKSDLYFLKGIGNSLLGNDEEEVRYIKKSIDFLEENPHQIKENPTGYASCLNNLLLYYYSKGYTGEFLKYLTKLDQFESKFSHEKAYFDEYRFNLKVGYYLFLRDKKNIQLSIIEMQNWYLDKKVKKSIQVKMICEYNIALVNFYLNDNKLALKWSNSCFSFFDMKRKKYRHDIAVSSLVIQTIIYYELGHYNLGLKALEIIFTIAKVNNYGEVELSIFNELQSLLTKYNLTEVIENMSNIIKNQRYKLITIDRDIVELWIEKNTK